jgi:hypothetical protein
MILLLKTVVAVLQLLIGMATANSAFNENGQVFVVAKHCGNNNRISGIKARWQYHDAYFGKGDTWMQPCS